MKAITKQIVHARKVLGPQPAEIVGSDAVTQLRAAGFVIVSDEWVHALRRPGTLSIAPCPLEAAFPPLHSLGGY